MFLVFLFVLVSTSAPIASQSIRNETFEAFRVCDDNSVQMYMWRNFGEGLWNASIEIYGWPQLSEIRMTLTLDAPASVELRKTENNVVASNGNRTFQIVTTQHNGNKVFLSTRYDPRIFPNVERVQLFNIDVCNDPIQVTITNYTYTHTISTRISVLKSSLYHL